MSKITGNEPAVGYSIPQNFDNFYDGMTIRQRFAMAAMQGMLSNPLIVRRLAEKGEKLKSDWLNLLVENSVIAANDLINELNKSEK